MEVTVQDEEDRPPGLPDDQPAESQDSRATALSTATEIAESLVDSVLSTSATEASRIQST